MPLPDAWDRALGSEARAALGRAEAFVSSREAAGVCVYPPAPLRYRALELIKPQAVRVVILAQDPYHRIGQAMGLALSVPRGVRIPPSLVNVYKELVTDIGFVPPGHGDLTKWAEQGVLLLNTSLTVEEGKPGSHSKIGWGQVTDGLIRCVSDSARAAVFLLWGGPARAKAHLVDRARHLVLESPHPSPLARGGFFGCKHFSQANRFLVEHGERPIQWGL